MSSALVLKLLGPQSTPVVLSAQGDAVPQRTLDFRMVMSSTFEVCPPENFMPTKLILRVPPCMAALMFNPSKWPKDVFSVPPEPDLSTLMPTPAPLAQFSPRPLMARLRTSKLCTNSRSSMVPPSAPHQLSVGTLYPKNPPVPGLESPE